MELIIKPTGRCNFNCKFCSMGNNDFLHTTKVSDKLREFITIYKPSTLIINGGDPLLSGIDYFYELLNLGDYDICIVTNLKAFYYNPEYWSDLFKNPRVGICTSFQYGSGRMWDSTTIYSDDLFKSVMDKFNNYVGYVPIFISVINNENESKASDHIYLAKELKTKCRLNQMLPLGLSTEFYPTYKIIDLWLKIRDLGLLDYLYYDIQFLTGGCDFNTNLLCTNTIRTYYEDRLGNSHVGCCDNNIFTDLDESKYQSSNKPDNLDICDLISNNCLSCELCRLCNACKVRREFQKSDKNHCSEMLKRKDRILSTDWKLY